MNLKEIKEATTDYPLIDLLKNRWSPRAFSDKKIEKETIGKLFEAGRWSPSCANSQSWRFIIGEKNENNTYERITKSLDEGNQIWTKTAPVLVVMVAKKTFDNGKENSFNQYDLGQSAAYITIQAMAENLYVHQMAGFNKNIIIEEFKIPDDFEPISVMAIGYLGELDTLSEKLKERELSKRERKSLSSLVFSEDWEKSYF